MYIGQNSTNLPNLTPIRQVWPKYDLWWPELALSLTLIILNLNSWQNLKSKHMYIGHISTNLPNLTLIRQVWPKFELWWPELTLNNIKSEFLTKSWDSTEYNLSNYFFDAFSVALYQFRVSSRYKGAL